jgi:hypothetical protein
VGGAHVPRFFNLFSFNLIMFAGPFAQRNLDLSCHV